MKHEPEQEKRLCVPNVELGNGRFYAIFTQIDTWRSLRP